MKCAKSSKSPLPSQGDLLVERSINVYIRNLKEGLERVSLYTSKWSHWQVFLCMRLETLMTCDNSTTTIRDLWGLWCQRLGRHSPKYPQSTTYFELNLIRVRPRLSGRSRRTPRNRSRTHISTLSVSIVHRVSVLTKRLGPPLQEYRLFRFTLRTWQRKVFLLSFCFHYGIRTSRRLWIMVVDSDPSMSPLRNGVDAQIDGHTGLRSSYAFLVCDQQRRPDLHSWINSFGRL